jgi:hypothetical protein
MAQGCIDEGVPRQHLCKTAKQRVLPVHAAAGQLQHVVKFAVACLGSSDTTFMIVGFLFALCLETLAGRWTTGVAPRCCCCTAAATAVPQCPMLLCSGQFKVKQSTMLMPR